MNYELNFEQPLFRPPSEAHSLLLRVTRNCPWNQCLFCCMYKSEKFQKREVEDVRQDVREMGKFYYRCKELSWSAGYGGELKRFATDYGVPWLVQGKVMTAFLADSDSLVMKTDDLVEIIKYLYETFPTIERLTSYARAKTIYKKTIDELKELRNAGLTRLHLGLETGSDELLKFVKKGVTAEESIEAGIKVKSAGISLSEYVILGLGGKKWWREHAIETARVLNEIGPDFIRVRTLVLLPIIPLYEKLGIGEFELSSIDEILQEEKLLIENLSCTSEFVSDHVSNYLNIYGKLPDDKEKMIKNIEEMLNAPKEVKERLIQPEYMRGL